MSYKQVCDNDCIVKCPNHLLNKLHVRSKPNCNFLFIKNKLGSSIYKKAYSKDFTLINSQFSPSYDALFDPNLKHFFKRQINLEHLRKNNFITQNNEVICSLLDFNDYRKYLHRMKTETVAAEKRVDYENDIDMQRLEISRNVFDKIYKNRENFCAKYVNAKENVNEKCAAEFAPFESVKETMRRRKLEQERERKMKFKANIEKYDRRLNEIQQLQHQKKNEQKERAFRRNLEIAKKQIFVSEKQQKHQISLRRRIIAQKTAMQAKLSKKLKSQQKTVDFIVKCPMVV